jgi:Zn-dependent M16 (insulinase) family peptidase
MLIDELLKDYITESNKQGEFTIKGDHKNGNKAAKKIQQILEKLVELHSDSKLLELLNDSNKWTQLWAATHTLEVNEAEALKKLEELKNENIPHISMSAKYTIMGWKEGNLKYRKK